MRRAYRKTGLIYFKTTCRCRINFQGTHCLRLFSFPKSERIRKRYEFVHLKEYGKAIHQHDFFAVVADSRQSKSRLGITVTKRIGNSVFRNKIKRTVREFYRTHKHRLPERLDINIVAKKSVSTRTPSELRQTLKKLFDDLNRRFDN